MATTASGRIKDRWISPAPVSCDEFAQFIRSGRYRDYRHWDQFPDQTKADLVLRRIGFDWQRRARPAINVSWYEADAYCRSLGGRLPFSDELEEQFSMLLWPPTAIPEWCADYFNPHARGPHANPVSPVRRRIFGWTAECGLARTGRAEALDGVVPDMIGTGLTFRIVLDQISRRRPGGETWP